jgi:hypothetical protein
MVAAQLTVRQTATETVIVVAADKPTIQNKTAAPLNLRNLTVLPIIYMTETAHPKLLNPQSQFQFSTFEKYGNVWWSAGPAGRRKILLLYIANFGIIQCMRGGRQS